MKIKRYLDQAIAKTIFGSATRSTLKQWAIAAIITTSPMTLEAFDSGSTGADGAFTPTVSQTVVLPADGTLNYTVVNIPSDVTITFARNDSNAPAVILAQGDVVIDGTISVSGSGGTSFGDARGGPGGFNGGIGANSSNGGNGYGPGGALGGIKDVGGNNRGCGGLGAGYANSGDPHIFLNCISDTGSPYGSPRIIPLIGGSGGGAGGSSINGTGTGGGGGGGALLIASSTTVLINGTINSKGGVGSEPLSSSGSSGGGGSGGAVRVIASTISGAGDIDVSGGLGGGKVINNEPLQGRNGSHGRIRFEADVITYSGGVLPTGIAASVGNPSDVFVANFPTIKITTVGGEVVPETPNGYSDVFLPVDTSNPITLEIAATDVPLGSVIQISATPTIGTIVGAISTPLAGTDASATTASANITLPVGPSVLTATVSYVVTAGMDSDQFSGYAMGEPVERVKISTVPGHGSETTFITASGKEYTWPSNTLAFR